MRTDEAGDVGAPHLGRALWCRRLWVPAADGAEDVRLLALIAPQIFILATLFLPDPIKNDVAYQVIAQICVLLLGGLGESYALDVGGARVSNPAGALGGRLPHLLHLLRSPLQAEAERMDRELRPWFQLHLAPLALFGTLTPDVVVLTLLYSIAGLGIAIVNDFKSIEGDRAMGLQSLPVAFGVDKAKWICVASIDATQLSVAGYLLLTGQTTYGLVLLALIAPQIFFQATLFLPDPIKNDVAYQGRSQPFLVFGLLCTAIAIGHSH